MKKLILITFLVPFGVLAHPGGMDSDRCHISRFTASKHCHINGTAIATDDHKAIVKFNKEQNAIKKYLKNGNLEEVETIYSSWIQKISYHSLDKVLIIIPVKNNMMIFSNITNDMWEMLKEAPSKGSYYHRYLKNIQKYQF